MSKKAPEVTYQIARPHQLPQIQKLMYTSFNKDEPMTRHLKLHQGAFSIPDIDGMVEGLVMDNNLSIMVLDKDQALLAVSLNGEFHRDEIDMPRQEVIDSCEDKKFAPLAALLHESQIRSREWFHKNNIETAFDLKIMTTSPSVRGRGLCADLISRSLLLARALGYKAAKAEATGDFSRKAFLSLGFSEEAQVKYKDFEFEGEQVFSGVEHQGCTFMVKLLD